MELPGSVYLTSLATIAITFVGFAALLIVVRQSIGGRLTRYDTYFALSFIQAGFIVTASGLVPPMLALFDWSTTVVWRASSFLMAIPIFLFVGRVPERRRAATGQKVAGFVRALLIVQACAALALLVNAVTALPKPGAIYATAVTVMLLSSGIAYLLALNTILPVLPSPAEETTEERVAEPSHRA